MAGAVTQADVAWVEHLRSDMESIYAGLTDGFRRQMRISELVYSAAEQFPEHLPSRAAIAAERELLQKPSRGSRSIRGSSSRTSSRTRARAST